MKIKQLFLLILLAAIVCGGAWYWNKETSKASSSSGGGAGGKLVEFPINDVARLTIQSSTGTVNLVRKDDGWTVEERADYPANFENVGNLLRKLWELKTVQEMEVGPSQFARFDLVDPGQGEGAGIRVDFKDKDGKPIGGLLVGKKFMKKSDIGVAEAGEFPAGRYVLARGGAKVSLVSDTLEDVNVKPESWLRRDFIKIENPSSVTLAGATDAQKWKLTRDGPGTEWKLAGATEAEKVDAAKSSQVGSVFAFPSFVDVLNPDAKPADTGLDNPVVLTFSTFDGFTYVLKVGKATGDNQPVTVEVSAELAKERTPGKDEKPEDKTKLDEEFGAKLKMLEEKLAAEKKFEGRIYLIAKATLDQLIKDRAAFLAENKPEAAPGDAPTPPRFPGPNASSATTPPISVTTPPIAVPPRMQVPAKNPPAPGRRPVTVTTPPVSVPPPNPASKPAAVPPAPGQPPAPDSPKEPPVPTPPKDASPSAGEKPPVPPPAKK